MNAFFQIIIALAILIFPMVLIIYLTDGKMGFQEYICYAIIVFSIGWFFDKNTSVFRN